MDRHSFSEPRPVLDSSSTKDLPTWQVDIFRQGVEEPIFTLLINNKTLPPRMRKKKVVWKLPDSFEEVPNFGSDEKKRMLELFKKQKKTRKKHLKRNSSIQSEASNSQQQEEENDDDKQQETNGRHSPEFYMVEDESAADVRANGGGIHDSSIPQHTTELPPLSSETNGHSSSSPLPMESPPRPPPIPPPGFAKMTLHHDEQVVKEPPPTPTPAQQSTQTTTPNTSPTRLDSPNARYFVVSPHSTNIPVDLAKSVVDVYYPCISHGHACHLLEHYAGNAQKSLSVGGAHAVCHSSGEFLLQLQSLQGSQFLVKGVVAQPGLGTSVVLLITGSVQNEHHALLPFCHSLTLVFMGNDGFQIHNDAMALLTE